MPSLRQKLQSMGVKLKAAELIGLLADLMKEHGDLPVYSLSGGAAYFADCEGRDS